MTFAEQLKEDYKQEFMGTIAQQLKQQGREEGEHRRAVAIAKKLIAQGKSIQYIQDLTGLPENEVMDLVDKH